jgi:phage tail tape-measure protein
MTVSVMLRKATQSVKVKLGCTSVGAGVGAAVGSAVGAAVGSWVRDKHSSLSDPLTRLRGRS